MHLPIVHGIRTNKTVRFCTVEKFRGVIYRDATKDEEYFGNKLFSYIKSSKSSNSEKNFPICSFCKYRGCNCALVGDAERPKKKNKALNKQSNKQSIKRDYKSGNSYLLT
jgi:hypothetical protein